MLENFGKALTRRLLQDMDRQHGHCLFSSDASAPFPAPMAIRADPRRQRAIDANGLALAHVYGQPDGSHCRLSEAEVGLRT